MEDFSEHEWIDPEPGQLGQMIDCLEDRIDYLEGDLLNLDDWYMAERSRLKRSIRAYRQRIADLGSE